MELDSSSLNITLNIIIYHVRDDAFEKALIVYASAHAMIKGYKFEFKVIGWSHFIYCRELDYYECVSCVETHKKPIASIAVSEPSSEIFCIDHNSMAQIDMQISVIQTTDSADNLSSAVDSCANIGDFIDSGSMIVSHAFPNGGLTSIHSNECGFHTIHTYPEYNSYVFTKTSITFKK